MMKRLNVLSIPLLLLINNSSILILGFQHALSLSSIHQHFLPTKHPSSARLYSTPPSITTTPNEQRPPAAPIVTRTYRSYKWKEHNINYRVEGPASAPPILLIHGFGANVNHFRFQFPTLVEEGYRVYAIDLLGFGASDKPPDLDYCIELWVDLLEDFVRDFTASEGETWVVAGNSIGGLCSVCLSARLPDFIRGCVLFNCAGGMTGFRYEEIPIWLRPVLYFVQKVLLGPSFGADFFKNFKTKENVESILTKQGVYVDTTNVDDELLELLLGPADDEGAEDVFLKVFGGPAGPTPESVLPDVKCPILALWGDSDPWTPVDKGLHPGKGFSQFNENFTLVTLPGVGHCPHDEAPELCFKYMLPWLSMLGDDVDDGKKRGVTIS